MTSKLQIKFVFDPYENQVIKHTFCGSKILITITNASTGDIQVTTPCKLHLSFCISHLIYIRVGSHSYACQIYSTTAIKSGHVVDCKEIRIVEVAGITCMSHVEAFEESKLNWAIKAFSENWSRDQGDFQTEKINVAKISLWPVRESSDQAHFLWIKNLNPDHNTSTGDIQVTIPCKLHLSFCISHLIYIRVGSHSYGCRIYSTTAIKSGHVIDCKGIRTVEVAGIKGSGLC